MAREASARARVAALDIEYTQALGADTPSAQSIREDAGRQARRAGGDEPAHRRACRSSARSKARWSCRARRICPAATCSKGTVLAHVLRREDISVKVVVPQADAGLIRADARCAR